MKWKDKIEEKHLRLSFHVILTVLVGYLAIKAVDHFGDIMLAAKNTFVWFKRILVPLAGGFAMAYLLQPPVRMFQKQLQKLPHYKKKKGTARSLSVAITLVLLVLLVFLAFSILISSVNRQVEAVSMESLESLVTSIGNSLTDLYTMIQDALARLNISSQGLNDSVTEMSNALGSLLQNLGNHVLGAFSHVQDFLTTFLFSVIFGVYFLIDGRNLLNYWSRVFQALFGHRAHREGKRLLNDADMVFSGYLRGQLIDALFMAIIVSITLSVIGVKLSILIGIATGIGNLIPYVGPFVAYISTALVCILNDDWTKLLVAMIVLFLIQTIDGNIINPKLLSNNVDIHPVLVIISLIIGGAAAGFVGMLIGVPIGAFLKIQFERFVDWNLERRKEKASDSEV